MLATTYSNQSIDFNNSGGTSPPKIDTQKYLDSIIESQK